MLFLGLLLVLAVSFIEFTKEVIRGDSGTSAAFTPETPLYYALALVLLQFIYPISSTLLVPLWSLSAEFYSNLISLYFGFNSTFRRILYGLVLGFLLICLSGIRLDLVLDWTSYKTWISGFGRAFLGFSIGQILWKCFTYRFEFNRRFLAFLFTISVGTTWATWIFAKDFMLISALLFFSLLIFTLAKCPSPNPGVRLYVVLKTLGETSYGVYLLHPSLLKLIVPLTNFQGLSLFVVSYIFILCVSFLFTRYLEPVIKSRILQLLRL
jgi:peptidoglycan/LPS O-acetylase OafA/YrhL